VSFGLDVHACYVQEFLAKQPVPFDAIVSFEVLEHVPDPVGLLRAMHELLQPEGVLVLSVPNLDDPYCLKQQIAAAMPPVHINFFNRRSLAAALDRAGLAVQRFFSLPVPTSSVRNIHGKQGFLLRLPILALRRLVGRADGTTLLAAAHRKRS
jgi:2-polyprenyl-3-methyl-5-hydroxy-6-metoxy-1,4-benzoquinol methylase